MVPETRSRRALPEQPAVVAANLHGKATLPRRTDALARSPAAAVAPRRRRLAGRLEPVAFAAALIVATVAFSAWSAGEGEPKSRLEATPAPAAARGHAG